MACQMSEPPHIGDWPVKLGRRPCTFVSPFGHVQGVGARACMWIHGLNSDWSVFRVTRDLYF